MMNLYNHQLKIIDEDPKKTGLFLGTGSGKTRTALMLAKGTILIIAPKTQVEDANWQREAGKVIPGVMIDVISKETFRRDHESLGRYDTIIVDEAHTVLGVTPNTKRVKKIEVPKASQLYEALEDYVNRTDPERIYLCTATIMKSPFTVWAAMQVLGKEVAPMPRSDDARYGNIDLNDFYGFREFFYSKLPMPGREVWASKKTDEVKDMLAKLVRGLGYTGRLEDFFDVPDQTHKTVYVELTAAQKARVKELRMEYPEPLVRVGKRHQVENGVLSGDEYTAAQTFPNAKVDKILEYAEEFPNMVIFARYRAQIDAIGRALKKAGRPVYFLTGDTKDRGDVIAAANKDPNGIFVAQCQVSAGWQLPTYPVMIFASKDYSFVNYDQALGRIQRANHIKRNLYIDLVVRGGIDEAVDKAILNKVDFNERLYVEEV